jgi:hypothetical protein
VSGRPQAALDQLREAMIVFDQEDLHATMVAGRAGAAVILTGS